MLSRFVLGSIMLAGAIAVGSFTPATKVTNADDHIRRFDFGSGKVEPGCSAAGPATIYGKGSSYGFEPGSKIEAVDRGGDDAFRGDFCTSDRPFFFSVDLPEGCYDVSVTLGDSAGESDTTVKAESRRLMLEHVHTKTNEIVKRTFTVNIRNDRIGANDRVRLKARESGVLHWDDKLTLEFNGDRPCVCGVEIARRGDCIVVYLAGDSTVTDQPREPWNSWGQMLPRFFQRGVAVANHAESGETLRSFIGEKRLDKILGSIKKGDYLFIQFGHNDQKERGEGAGAFTTYKQSLKRLIAEAKKRGAIPVLVTPINRRTFDSAGKVTNSLGDYPDAVRQTATEENVALIDLNAMSKTLYEALGVDESKRAFVDNTHHNAYGSYESARCIVEGIRANRLDLARFIVDDVPSFDPAKPDAVASIRIPPSPERTNGKPEGD